MLPLADVRILSVEQYGAGPFATVHLADLGAEVIKVEDPSVGGDVGRYVPPYSEGEDSLFFETFNRNKRSISINLNTPAGRAVFEDLVKVSDVVYSNLRGDVPKKMRITYDDLKHLNPKIVCCSLTGFGMTGPRSQEPGYDYILQGLAGWMDLTGEPDGPPTKSGLSMVDYSGGLISAISLLVALHAARRDGVGMDCDLAQTVQQRRVQQDRGAHVLREFVVGEGVAKRGVVHAHDALVAVPLDLRTLGAEERDELVEVGDVRDIFQRDGLIGEQRGAEDGQHGVLVAGGRDGAGEGLAAVDDEVGHRSEKLRAESRDED